MKTKIISLMLVLSCAGASAATALPNSSGDRALWKKTGRTGIKRLF